MSEQMTVTTLSTTWHVSFALYAPDVHGVHLT